MKYEGTFKNGGPHGKNQIVYDPWGNYYIGKMSDGVKEGAGCLYYAGGQLLYSGYFKNNEPTGKYVKLYYSDGKIEFIGEMKAGKREGWGKLFHMNGQSFYTGEFKSNEPNCKHASLFRDNGIILYQGVLRFGFNRNEEYYLHLQNNSNQ